MKTAVCLIIKDENEYLEEWLLHHIKVGFDHFMIYDNGSKNCIGELRNKLTDKGIIKPGIVSVYTWKDNEVGSQCRAYKHACEQVIPYTGIDWMLFIDTDEFYTSNTMNVKEDLTILEKLYGKFDALGLSWRMYGNDPYFETRQPIEKYNQYHTNGHIKSIVRPSAVINFPDPHKAIIKGRYINEDGLEVKRPICRHHSKFVWIKHIYTRSLPEWKEKIERGSGDHVKRTKTLEEFYNYNKQCQIKESQS